MNRFAKIIKDLQFKINLEIFNINYRYQSEFYDISIF